MACVIALGIAEHQRLAVGLPRLAWALLNPHSPLTGPAGRPQLVRILVLVVPIAGLDLLEGVLRPGPVQCALAPSS